jgi:hypothetical protein
MDGFALAHDAIVDLFGFVAEPRQGTAGDALAVDLAAIVLAKLDQHVIVLL